MEPISALPTGATLLEYVNGLATTGVRVLPGSDGTYWVAYGDRHVRRLPAFHVGTPSRSEVDRVLRTTGALIATYLAEPDSSRRANAWLYLCSDQDYSHRRLPPAMQRNLRRGLRELTVSSLSHSDVLAHGGPAFCDTRQRNGLNDGTLVGFRRYFGDHIDLPGEAYLGAWRTGQLTAFIMILQVDDWAELNCYSMSSMLEYRPNDVLMHLTLSHYLSERRYRVVSYGVSSLQTRSNAAGLHRFKEKVGFNPTLVHRAFVLHPTLRLFANPVTIAAAHWTVSRALQFRPLDRRLQKVEGMLASLRGTTRMVGQAEEPRSEVSLSEP